jgi:hypothetical protein
MPDPQPAWAQQYNRDMQPVWDRKFEPPAITGLESQNALDSLLLLYRETGNRAYLEPIPKALAYLKKSVLPDGKISRFYELKTNRPLYFTKDYQLTYEKKDLPTHYGFVVSSRLDAIESEYRRLVDSKDKDPKKESAELTGKLIESTKKALVAQDSRGAWVETGTVRDAQGRKSSPKEGVVHSQTFIDNVTTLCRYLKATP